MAVISVNAQDFDREVLLSAQPVLVDFYADWCGPCKMLAPIVENVAAQKTDVKVCRVNVDDAGEIAARYGIMSIPTLIVFQGGQAVKKSIGLIGEQDVLALL